MRTILTASVLCAALLFAAVSAVHAKALLTAESGTVTPIVVTGE